MMQEQSQGQGSMQQAMQPPVAGGNALQVQQAMQPPVAGGSASQEVQPYQASPIMGGQSTANHGSRSPSSNYNDTPPELWTDKPTEAAHELGDQHPKEHSG